MNSRTLIIASLTSALGATSLAALAAETPSPSKSEAVPCYGVNKCKGVGDCGGKGHSCAGKNSCKGQGYLDMSKDLCLKIEGGRLTENPETVTPTAEQRQPKKS